MYTFPICFLERSLCLNVLKIYMHYYVVLKVKSQRKGRKSKLYLKILSFTSYFDVVEV